MSAANVVIDRRNLSWIELANLYAVATGQTAREKPNGTIVEWAKRQKDRFLVDDDGIHLLVRKA